MDGVESGGRTVRHLLLVGAGGLLLAGCGNQVCDDYVTATQDCFGGTENSEPSDFCDSWKGNDDNLACRTTAINDGNCNDVAGQDEILKAWDRCDDKYKDE
jgi:hypothetical protein